MAFNPREHGQIRVRLYIFLKDLQNICLSEISWMRAFVDTEKFASAEPGLLSCTLACAKAYKLLLLDSRRAMRCSALYSMLGQQSRHNSVSPLIFHQVAFESTVRLLATPSHANTYSILFYFPLYVAIFNGVGLEASNGAHRQRDSCSTSTAGCRTSLLQ